MASLDSLPADQRAVLQLVLQRGRSYDDIAALLSIDRAGVRERALTGLDALGPVSELEAGRRALITDYLLGQLPPRVASDVRDRLSGSPAERAWARVVASELAPLAKAGLPEIPAGTASPDERPAEPDEDHEPGPSPVAAGAGSEPKPARERPGLASDRPTSRRGGAILLAIGLLIVIVVAVIVLIASSGSGGSSSQTSSTQASASTASGSTTSVASQTATGTTSGRARPVAQVNLTSPTGARNVGGVAIVVRQGTNTGLVIRAQGLTPNQSHDAYAVWLYNSPSDSRNLGFVNPPVKASGVLQAATSLPVGASHFKQVLISLETQQKPRTPTKIVLQGVLNLSG